MSEDQPNDRRDDLREFILPRFSLDRRVTVLVILMTAMVVGIIATLGIPLELIPRGYDDPSLGVRVLWNQAPAQEILDKVTLPLEEELSTVPGLQDIFSNAQTGFGSCFLRFKVGTDMDVAYREVRDRIERAKARMPDDVDRILIQKQDDNAIPVAFVGLAIDDSVTDSYDLIQNEILLPLERIDGVANVDTRGLQEREIMIELDRDRVAAAGLNIWQLSQELSNDNFSLSSGHVFTGEKKLLLRSVAKYRDVEALENRMIGPSVRLKDIADVTYDVPEALFRVRVNSEAAVMVLVFKEGDANAIEVSEKVLSVVDELKENPRLSLFEIDAFFDQGSTIKESLMVLLNSGKIGGIFAGLVLFFFLRRHRLTLIVTLSIPLSLLIGLTAMYFFGETLNILTLLGLMISVGLLVDNSVVVAENIYRLHREGLDRRDACIRGAGEISLAIIMATLTTVIVFLPVSLVEGQGQFFLLRLALPITVSLVASLFVALIFIPLSVYMTLPANAAAAAKKPHPVGEFTRSLMQRAYEATFERLNSAYTRMLGFFLRRRMDLVMGLLVVCALTGIPMQVVKVVDVQEEERSQFDISVVFPQSTTLEEAEEYFDQVEEILDENQEDLDLDGYLFFHVATNGNLQGWLNKPQKTDQSPREIIEKVVALLPERGGTKIYTGQESETEEETRTVHMLTLQGEDAGQLEDLAGELEDVFASLPGVLGVKRSGEVEAEELALVVDRDRSQALGINPEVVAGVVSSTLRGQPLPKFYQDGREIPVRVRFKEEDRETLAQLYDFQVPTGSGGGVSLASVTQTERLEAPKRIFRRNKQMSRTITLELEEGQEDDARASIVALSTQIDLPEGVRFGSASRGRSQNDDLKSMQFAATLSVAFIYLLMGFLFESFILPLSIVTTIPLAILGVYWIHYLTGFDLDFLGFVGIVLLIGVVVNNGIVLVDYVNRLRAEGMKRTDAVLLAANRRFRPIMMTALTTISGMVPLTLSGTTSIGLSYTSFGLTLIGGMTSATFLTLLVVPITYTLFDDLRWSVTAVLHRALGKTPPSSGAPSEGVEAAA